MKLNSNCELEQFDDGQSVIYNSQDKKTYILNETATLILSITLENPDYSVEQIKNEYLKYIVSTFELEISDNAENDFDESFSMLKDEQIFI